MLAIAGIAAGGVALSRNGHVASPLSSAPDYREALVTGGREPILNPLLAHRDPASRDVARLTARALLRLDDRAQVVPDLASSWGVSGDGLTYRFTLPEGRRFSDGSPLTARDAAASIAAVQQPGFPDPATAAAWKGVVVHVEGATALSLSLPTPRAMFAATVTDLPVVPAAAASGPVARLVRDGRKPVAASGPYRIIAVGPGSLRLAANPQWRPVPHLGLLELRLVRDFDSGLQALAAGEVDGLEATTPAERAAVARIPGVHLRDTVSFRFVDLLLNARRPGLRDIAVRRAIASAIDRQAIVAGPLDGDARAQVSPIPAGIAWLGPQPAEQPSPELAARALDAAGWRVPPGGGPRMRAGERLEFTLSVPAAPPLPAVAATLTAQLAPIGVVLRVKPLPVDRFSAEVLPRSAFDLAVADWDNGSDPDVSSFWRSNAAPPAGFNVSGVPADPFLDRALDGLASENDPQLRLDAARTVERLLAEEVPAAFLYAPKTSLATDAAFASVRVPAVGSPWQRFDDVAGWQRSG